MYNQRPIFLPSDAQQPPHFDRTTVIGFSGVLLRGTLVFCAAQPLLNTLWGMDDSPPADWIGEIGNQLLGMIKQQLLSHDVSFDVGLPTNMSAKLYRMFIRDDSSRLNFSVGDASGLVCFQYNHAPELIANDEPTPSNVDDDIILF